MKVTHLSSEQVDQASQGQIPTTNDLVTYSRGKRSLFLLINEKNYFVEEVIQCRKYLPLTGTFTLIGSSNLCNCKAKQVVMFKPKMESFWRLAIISTYHYLTPSREMECEFDLWEWVGPVNCDGVPQFFGLENWFLMSHHFKRRICLSETTKLVFANVARGDHSIVNPLTRNATDGGIQCSKDGPCSLPGSIELPRWRQNTLSKTLQDAKPPSNHSLFEQVTRKHGTNGKQRKQVSNNNDSPHQRLCALWCKSPKRIIKSTASQQVVIVEHTMGPLTADHARKISEKYQNHYMVPCLKKNNNGLVTFRYVDKDNFKTLSSTRFHQVDFDSNVTKHGINVCDLFEVDNSSSDVFTRIFAGKSAPHVDNTYSTVRLTSSSVMIHHKICQADEYKAHVPVSVSLFDSKCIGIQVQPMHISLLYKAMGTTSGLFQKRTRSAHKGSLSYIGPRDIRSSMAQPSPSEGPMEKGYTYYRQTISHMFWPFLLHFGHLLISTIAHVRFYLHPYLCILPELTEKDPLKLINVCEILIITVNFFCTIHVDNDLFEKRKEDCCHKLSMLQEEEFINTRNPEFEKERARQSLEYVNEWGVGAPTTCAYQFVEENPNDEVEIIQYFCCVGLGVCYRIRNYWIHMFCAYCFSHLTSVPLFIKNDTVYVGKYPGKQIFAWGTGRRRSNI